jgi:hypothetical protein
MSVVLLSKKISLSAEKFLESFTGHAFFGHDEQCRAEAI